MRGFVFAIALCSVLSGISCMASAADTAIPATAWDQTYQSCLSKIGGSDDGTSLESKKKYCGCVRDKLAASWDAKKVSGLADQYQATGKTPDMTLTELESVGKECIAQIMGMR